VPAAHGGRLFRKGSVLVALNMEKVIESMERTMRLQLKLTPLSRNFAMRTLVFIFCALVSDLGCKSGLDLYSPSPLPVPFPSFPHASPRFALP
jgi:hypothetical protein